MSEQSALSGPSFEPPKSEFFEAQECLVCGNRKRGAHYNQYHIRGGIAALKDFFPNGEANDLNFVLFSTSGVHGSYTTIEEIEETLIKFGPDFEAGGEEGYPSDFHGYELTVLIVQPRLCCLRHGNITVDLADIPFLRKLRESSQRVVQKIG